MRLLKRINEKMNELDSKLMKVVGLPALAFILVYTCFQVKSNMDNGADNIFAALMGQGDSRRQAVVETVNTEEDTESKVVRKMTEMINMLIDNYEEQGVEAYVEFLDVVVSNKNEKQYYEFELIVNGENEDNLYIRLDSEANAMFGSYSDGIEISFDDLIDDVKANLESRIEKEEEPVKVEPTVNTNVAVSLEDAKVLMEINFPGLGAQYIENVQDGYLFSVYLEGELFHYTVSKDEPTVYDQWGDIIYTR